MTFLLISILPLTSHAFSLAWPIDCEFGKTCFIQNYVNHDTATGPANFACDNATFDGLTGTDIRIQSLAVMRTGVNVRAAADGTVLGTRDGVDDISIREANAPDVKDRECGNGVHIQNAEGYSTQYCHLRKGSVRVHTGQAVKAGDVLGLVGLSGETEFPHLHLNVMKGDDHIDPFTSAPASAACDANLITSAPQLWAVPIAYHLTNLLTDGVVDSVPDSKAMLDTPVSQAALPVDAPALLYWVWLIDLKPDDKVTLTITAPDGSIFIDHTANVPRALAQHFYYVGKRNVSGDLAPGIYHPRVQVLRNNVTILDVTRAISVQ